jgi:hypothetical protein
LISVQARVDFVMALTHGAKWVRFLRQYGPIPRNDNMYDEHIRKSARRAGVSPISFVHPIENEVLSLFGEGAARPMSVVLTGTAGDGKSNLCGKIWKKLGGPEAAWDSDQGYHRLEIPMAGKPVTVHVLRDLTAMPQADPEGRYADKQVLLAEFSQLLFGQDRDEVFLIAANDGQLVETWQRLPSTDPVIKARALFESLLVEDGREEPGVPLQFFNLSRIPCTALFDLAVSAFLDHEGWKACYDGQKGESEFFGPNCPIRRNYELLRNDLIRSRLRSLFELCDCNDLHLPIRRILLLLSNAVLGHPDSPDRIMQPTEVPKIIQKGTVAKASLFNNIFGGNLTETRRESLEIFDHLNRFRIGHETSNRVDNILIFGEADDNLRPYFEALLAGDRFYGADSSFEAAQRAYVEGADDDDDATAAFLQMLISQRRRLFFTIPADHEEELSLWDLTVFSFAGEYLDRVLKVLRANGKVSRAILARLVRGLNRIFVGMLVGSDRELLLATSVSFSNAKVSQILEDRIPVTPRLGERVELALVGDKPVLRVQLSDDIHESLRLNLTRYEFLCRVAEGALPGSFSRECYEDMLAFKCRLLSCLERRRDVEGASPDDVLTFRLMTLDPSGNPLEEPVEVRHG